MKAIVRDTYGSPDVVELREIDRPPVSDDGVLVRVRAASVNPVDWHMLTGTPYLVRLESGLRRPKNEVLGTDFAGTVEAVGKDVNGFSRGTRSSEQGAAPSRSTSVFPRIERWLASRPT
jgi:NADPH:quinone reductase-like Zn-dependent oxidoreductase